MIRTKLLPALFLVAGTSGAGAAPSIQADIPYATSAAGEPLRLDLYLPESGAGAALIVWVHGGAWEAGNKSAMPLEPLIERGFAVASVDFSPASKAPFPGQVHEIKAAIRYLRAQAGRYGYDASRIGIAGASSETPSSTSQRNGSPSALPSITYVPGAESRASNSSTLSTCR